VFLAKVLCAGSIGELEVSLTPDLQGGSFHCFGGGGALAVEVIGTGVEGGQEHGKKLLGLYQLYGISEFTFYGHIGGGLVGGKKKIEPTSIERLDRNGILPGGSILWV